MMGVFFMYPIDRFFVITSPPKTLKTIFSKKCFTSVSYFINEIIFSEIDRKINFNKYLPTSINLIICITFQNINQKERGNKCISILLHFYLH